MALSPHTSHLLGQSPGAAGDRAAPWRVPTPARAPLHLGMQERSPLLYLLRCQLINCLFSPSLSTLIGTETSGRDLLVHGPGL